MTDKSIPMILLIYFVDQSKNYLIFCIDHTVVVSKLLGAQRSSFEGQYAILPSEHVILLLLYPVPLFGVVKCQINEIEKFNHPNESIRFFMSLIVITQNVKIILYAYLVGIVCISTIYIVLPPSMPSLAENVVQT